MSAEQRQIGISVHIATTTHLNQLEARKIDRAKRAKQQRKELQKKKQDFENLHAATKILQMT